MKIIWEPWFCESAKMEALSAVLQWAIHLLSASILDVSRTFRGKVSLFSDSIAANDALGGFSEFNATTKGSEKLSLSADPSTDEITSMKFLTTASTWAIGTRITIYGVKR